MSKLLAAIMAATVFTMVGAALLATSGAPIATLATPIHTSAELFDPACVKVARSLAGDALYFSRAPMLRHIGIYAYRAGFLRRFAALPPTPLERTEALEQLRALEHGHRIAVGIAPEAFPPGVDTEADVARVEALLASAAPA